MRQFIYISFILLAIFSSCSTPQEEDLNLKHVKHIAHLLNNDLLSIKANIVTTSNILQYKIPFDNDVEDFSNIIYKYSSNGILLSKYHEKKSAIYYPSGRNNLKHLKKIIINSEALDSVFINSLNQDPLLSQIYFIDTNSFLRIYPYIDVINYLKPNIDLTLFAPYQLVYNKPFINDEVYWLNKPFADPYGRGWIISCVEPIYYRDHFLGILSGDISLQSIKAKYFSHGVELLLLLDQNGEIICCTKEAGKITNIPQLREFGYYKPITEDIYNYNNPSLTEHKNKSLSKAVKSILLGETIEHFNIDYTKHTIYGCFIEETDWCLLKIIN
jgi:hypothetical protein